MSSLSPIDIRAGPFLRGGRGGSELELGRVDSSFCTGDLDFERRLDRAAVPLARRSQLGLIRVGGFSWDDGVLSRDVTDGEDGGGELALADPEADAGPGTGEVAE